MRHCGTRGERLRQGSAWKSAQLRKQERFVRLCLPVAPLPVLARRSRRRRSRRRRAPDSARHARPGSATARPPASPAVPASAAGMTVRVAVAPTNCGDIAGQTAWRTLRPQPVGADERAARRSSHRPRSWPARPSLGLASEASAKPGRSVDAGLGRGRGQQRRVQIAAVRHPVGCAVPGRNPAAQRQHRPNACAVLPSCTRMASGTPTSGRSASAPRPGAAARARRWARAECRRPPPQRCRAAPARSSCGPSAPAPGPAPGRRCRRLRSGSGGRRGHGSVPVRRARAQAAAVSGLTRQPSGSVASGARRASWT